MTRGEWFELAARALADCGAAIVELSTAPDPAVVGELEARARRRRGLARLDMAVRSLSSAVAEGFALGPVGTIAESHGASRVCAECCGRGWISVAEGRERCLSCYGSGRAS